MPTKVERDPLGEAPSLTLQSRLLGAVSQAGMGAGAWLWPLVRPRTPSPWLESLKIVWLTNWSMHPLPSSAFTWITRAGRGGGRFLKFVHVKHPL